jgi:glycosyltransferase involved in cell wall biosynthesis
MKQNVPVILKSVLSLEANRVARYEGSLVRQFDHTLAVTEIDHQALLRAARIDDRVELADRIRVVPIAIDTTVLVPVQRTAGSHNIVALGTLLFPPNADGIRWFTNEVFPLVRCQVPDVTLTIIGKGAPVDLVRLSSQSSGAITITGYVPDLVPYLEKAALMVVPVRAGGGMRVRILEAFARGIPVVTTSVGLEGIDAKPGEEILVEDTAERYAVAVVQLLKDLTLQTRLAANGRRFVETYYDWQVVLRKLDDIYA